MNVTARKTGVATQKRLVSISRMTYRTPHRMRFSTATKLALVNILPTNPQPVSHMLFDSWTRVADSLTPICRAATPTASTVAMLSSSIGSFFDVALVTHNPT